MSAKVLLSSVTGAQTALCTVTATDIGPQGHMTLSFYSSNSADTLDLQFTQDDGSNWRDVYVGGSQVTLTDTNRIVPLDTICQYRLSGTLAGTATVAIHRGVEV